MTSTDEIETRYAAMLGEVRERGHAWRPGVKQALHAVPREAFIPEATIEEALDAHTAYVTKRAADGRSLSSASAPTIVALMLDQLDVQLGHRVLEIGAGTGYNAALLSHLVGRNGHVVTVDIDPDATTRARTALNITGHTRVEVITGDGADGAPGCGEFDRIVITAGAWDVPPAWTEQLAPDGRLVLPLRWRGQTRAVVSTHHPDRQLLRSDSMELCGFIPMTSPDGELEHPLDDYATTLHYDRDQEDIAPTGLHNILEQSGLEVWSGITIGHMEPVDGVWMRLSADPGAAWIKTDAKLLDATGRPHRFRPQRTSCLIKGDSLALFRFRSLPDTERTEDVAGELGVLGFGPAGPKLVDRVLAAIHTWDTDRTHQPEFTLHPADTPDHELPDGTVIDKIHRRLVLRYPN